MGYRTLSACLDDLAATGQLVRIEQEIDANLEAAEIHRRVFQAGGPALLFTRVKGGAFPMASNLFGTMDRVRFIFRDTLEAVRRAVEAKVDPSSAMRRPWEQVNLLPTLWRMLPKRVQAGPILKNTTTISKLPQLKCWPDDGGAFITLPLVFTEDPDEAGLKHSNLGMYRVQLSGGRYQPDQQIGLHYQIHRGIGVHHARAINREKTLRVNIFVGGAPAMSVAAVMPLPEGMSELGFAGALAGHRIPMITGTQHPAIYAEADFCITGTIERDLQLPEGPFGDHLGYYSLAHDYPVLRVEQVFHRPGAIWPFTVVGRPPQEDTMFGELIHEITGPAIPTVIPGLQAVHAVDAAGVHPLLLAIGSERYTPYNARRRPQELLTTANAILGQGQLSLAKYLWIAAREDELCLHIQDIPQFFGHMLRRVDWTRDLHFQTRTTIDTLDYSGDAINEGSKLVVAAVGPAIRELPTSLDGLHFPAGYGPARVCMPGVIAISGPPFPASPGRSDPRLDAFCQQIAADNPARRYPLWVIVDDADFTSHSLNNFLWTTFTRSNPATDVYGVESFIDAKHWGCRGPLVIDARAKPHHAPPLIEDPAVCRRVDELAARGGPLHGII